MVWALGGKRPRRELGSARKRYKGAGAGPFFLLKLGGEKNRGKGRAPANKELSFKRRGKRSGGAISSGPSKEGPEELSNNKRLLI